MHRGPKSQTSAQIISWICAGRCWILRHIWNHGIYLYSAVLLKKKPPFPRKGASNCFSGNYSWMCREWRYLILHFFVCNFCRQIRVRFLLQNVEGDLESVNVWMRYVRLSAISDLMVQNHSRAHVWKVCFVVRWSGCLWNGFLLIYHVKYGQCGISTQKTKMAGTALYLLFCVYTVGHKIMVALAMWKVGLIYCTNWVCVKCYLYSYWEEINECL